MEVFERKYSLLEYFDDRDAADVFYGFFVHSLQRVHVTFHEVCVVTAHHLLQEKYAEDQRDETTDTKSPVEDEDQDQNSDRHYDRAGEIRELMCQKVFGQSGVVIDDLSQTSAGILAEIAKGQGDNVVHGCFFHVCGSTERCQMGAAQCDKIK